MNFKFTSDIQVTLSETVIEHCAAHRQLRDDDKEAGGQLFARIEGSHWTILRATGPRKSDWRTRFGFRPNRNLERKEIRALFSEGLHYVGDWHTHPQDEPRPSNEDLQSMQDMVKKSQHELPGFLMMIVGRAELPKGLWLSLHTEQEDVIEPDA
jgi:integrative and conjugative element protein (TIGR02256 family)